VQKAAADIPAEIRARLEAATRLSDEDRETIVGIARQALTEFLTGRAVTGAKT
jgi:F-type H+-transporting ATPase subunit alpha